MGFIIHSWIHGLQASVLEQWTDYTDNLQMGSYEIYEKKIVRPRKHKYKVCMNR